MNAMPAVQHFEFAQPHVPGLATYDYVRPTGAEGDLPLLLLLHGGDGGEGHLQRMLPMLQYCWQSGDLPACVCVTPKCGMSYYLNYRNGQENWEDLVVHGIPEQISRAHGGVDLSKILIAGISMGGTGTLRMAFRYPSKFIAAAAMEPGVEEAFDFTDIPARNTFWRAVPFEVAHGEPVDSEWWAANNIAGIARSNAAAIQTSGLKLYLEVGTEDCMLLHHGVEFLHRLLWDRQIKHEYRTVLGADHIGMSLLARTLDAFRFLGRAIMPQPADSDLQALRELMDAKRLQAGLSVTGF